MVKVPKYEFWSIRRLLLSVYKARERPREEWGREREKGRDRED